MLERSQLRTLLGTLLASCRTAKHEHPTNRREATSRYDLGLARLLQESLYTELSINCHRAGRLESCKATQPFT